MDIVELYGITDAATIEKLAISDVMSKLEHSIREELKVLHLAGNTTLEPFLELAKSKLSVSSLTNVCSTTFDSHGVTSSANTDRLTRLERLMETLVMKTSSTNVKGQSTKAC